MSEYYKVVPSCQVKGLDGIYQKYIGRIQDGAFVEVGAFDGVSWSNTSCLADRGWRGLLFEPWWRAFKRCQRHYRDNPRIQVVQCCVGNYVGEIEVFPGEQLTTTSWKQVEIYRTLAWAARFHPVGKETFMSPVFTLDFVLDKYGWEPGFEVLVIDTEGTELQVLEGFDIARWRPKLAIVECQYGSSGQGEDTPAVYALFDEHGYERVYVDNTNTVFVGGDHG